MAGHDYKKEYQDHINKLKSEHPIDEAMSLAVGGSFKTMGGILGALLYQEGLTNESYLIDVGCGSGRLAFALREGFAGKYLGVDIVPDLVEYARDKINLDNFKFQEAPGLHIPEVDNVADYVCFFSVFTHLRHEESYVYLNDAKRVLKPGGKVIFSFLDITEKFHQDIFELNVRQIGENVPLNQFLDKNMIDFWCEKLGFNISGLEGATTPFIEIKSPFIGDDGHHIGGSLPLGQSICVLESI